MSKSYCIELMHVHRHEVGMCPFSHVDNRMFDGSPNKNLHLGNRSGTGEFSCLHHGVCSNRWRRNEGGYPR